MTTSCVVCGVRIQRGSRCSAHDWRGEYRTATYQRNRKAALERDGHSCVLCGRGPAEGIPVEVDHRLPILDGGTSDVTNLFTLCRDCHQAKTQQQRIARLVQ